MQIHTMYNGPGRSSIDKLLAPQAGHRSRSSEPTLTSDVVTHICNPSPSNPWKFLSGLAWCTQWKPTETKMEGEDYHWRLSSDLHTAHTHTQTKHRHKGEKKEMKAIYRRQRVPSIKECHCLLIDPFSCTVSETISLGFPSSMTLLGCLQQMSRVRAPQEGAFSHQPAKAALNTPVYRFRSKSTPGLSQSLLQTCKCSKD